MTDCVCSAYAMGSCVSTIPVIATPTPRTVIPRHMYHGSPRHDLPYLKPFPSTLTGGKDVVFATPEMWFALVCGTQARDGEIEFGYDGNTPFVRELQYGVLSKHCTLYIVAHEHFNSEPLTNGCMCDGMGVEYISYYGVRILGRCFIPDVAAELINNHPDVTVHIKPF